MPNEITEEMLQRFAELGGWTDLDAPNLAGVKWGRHPVCGEMESLPRFRQDLAACFEVVRYAGQKNNWCIEIMLDYRIGIGDVPVVVEIKSNNGPLLAQKRSPDKLEDALILAAVLASQKAEAKEK
jgi:hypothetical protein